MQVLLEDLGKRFGKEWIVRHLNLSLSAGNHLAILGPNGSGKSTLLKLLASFHLPTEGRVTYRLNQNDIAPEEIFRFISIAAPYMELTEQLTVREVVEYHAKFKPLYASVSTDDLIHRVNMDHHGNKAVKQLSSGMKMRLRLALAIYSDTPFLLLDEPLSNLDASTKNWYQEQLEEFKKNRLIVICSNHQPDEYFLCEQTFDLTSGEG